MQRTPAARRPSPLCRVAPIAAIAALALSGGLACTPEPTGAVDAGSSGVDGREDAGSSQTGEGEGEGEDAGAGLNGRECASSDGAQTLQALAARFSDDVYPLMIRDDGAGCTECHGEGSARQMRMGSNGEETFYRVRAGGHLRLTTGSMLDRLDHEEMPEDGTPWTESERGLLFAIACDLATIDSAGVPPDEEFPADLLQPYTGPPSVEYDDTFLTYDQLKSRVVQQFDDDWVRLGVDEFSRNIALFGGVDFQTTFIPARQATPEFLVGLDLLAEDVCQRAATDGTGPFAGHDCAAPTQEEPPSTPTVHEAEAPATVSLDYTGDVRDIPWTPQTSGGVTFFNFFTSGGVRVDYTAPIAGTYRFTVRARGQEAGPDLPHVEVRAPNNVSGGADVPAGTGFSDHVMDLALPQGDAPIFVMFTNDYYDPDHLDPAQRDRNLLLDKVTIEGPLPGTTGGAPGARAATFDRIATIFSRILLRAPVRGAAEPDLQPLYDMMLRLEAFDADRTAAWSGVCQALMSHPDFLFTRPPRFDLADPGERARLLVVKTAFDLLDRPPTPEELLRFDMGQERTALIDEWLQGEEAAAAYYKRVRLFLESDGSEIGDEPARLWSFVMREDRPLREVLTADYTVDAAFTSQPRPLEHGQTGLLTMQGYVRGKPGLPHYNYAARVMTGFLGYVFEVPPEVFEQRATATAATTVDPGSVCYSCHKVLTPLAHQRLRWGDDGTYRTQFEDGRPIDDSDHDLVAEYPYRGPGIESFSLVAVRKEGFIRRMANLHFQLSFGRLLRHEADERDLYRDLWDTAARGEGTFKDLLRTILTSEAYVNPVGTRPGDVVEAP